ncbi:MAG: hypothetical protein CMQ24_10025 [Gammaproteobacteria bacterium]|nr:hypothetical protein [Gammaproteobacteria bacterium]
MLDQIKAIAEDEHLLAFLTTLLVFVIAFGLYWETTWSMVAQWTDNGNYSHGLLAIAVSIYLVWERRAELGQLRPAPHWFGLLATLGFGGLWLVAGLGNVLVVQQICVIGLLNAVAFAIYGPRVYVVLAFPLLTIFLVTPIWNVLENPVRDLSTVVTHVVLEMLSMPVLLEGYEVTVPGGRFVIEPACSRLGFFLCSGLIGAYFAYFNRLGLRQMGGLHRAGIGPVDRGELDPNPRHHHGWKRDADGSLDRRRPPVLRVAAVQRDADSVFLGRQRAPQSLAAGI